MKVIKDFKFSIYKVTTEDFTVKCNRTPLPGTCATDVLIEWERINHSDSDNSKKLAKAIKAIVNYIIEDEEIYCIVFTDSGGYDNIYSVLTDKYFTKEEGYTVFQYRPHGEDKDYNMRHVVYVKSEN